jgi:rod shape-determining protein MreD|tara:strand:+ start:329 stop:832 length:504 start_codon:yes stop_codon:yes gene_type:complete
MLNNLIFVNITRFFLLILVQVLILNQINLFGYVNPYLYILFIIIYPFTANKSLLIFSSFLLGLFVDVFSDSGGIHAAASVFIAFIRPAILKYSFGISYEYNTIKISSKDYLKQMIYVGSMVFLHHFILFALEIFNINHFLLFLNSVLFSSIFSIVIILCTITLFSKK